MVQTPEESLLQLQTLWLKCSNEVESVVKKEELLKEFLYKVYCVNFELPQETKLITSFLSTVLEDICSFLLERVHQIISKSKLFSESEDNVDKDDDCVHTMETTTSDKTKILRDKHNFAQLVLRAPSDYGKIVALRTFLTHEIGHHILYFLRSVNIKLLASQSSLCNLCINLFPNCRWEDNQNNVDSSSSLESMQAFVESIQFHPSSQEHHLKKLAEPKDLFNRGIQQNDAYVESEYTAYVQQVRTSDEIAAVLIDLLIKCVDVESEMVLSDQSMSVVCWKFAIEKLAAKDETFASDNNGKVIKRKLLRLTAKCFNNACCHKDNFGLLDLKCTIAKLMNALTENANQEIIFGINYLVFSLINNVIIQSDGKLHDAIRFVDEEILDKYVASLIAVMNRPQMEINPLFGSFIDVLLRIIDNTNKVLRTKAKKVRKKFKYDIQRHCNRSNFPCFFQKLLFNILEHLSSELQKQVLRYLHRQGICCCLCNIGTMQVLLSRSIHHANRRIALDFIHKKILQTVLVRNGCEMCDFKYKSSEFNRSITMAYYNAVICMDGPDEIHCYIRHFRHISHVINGDMAVCIMGTIVLPVFRQNINCAANKSNSVPLLLECLNTFVAYLIDTRLIKAFYNNDNISLLQNLMYQHEFTRCVSDLMRIGIDFGSFLGEEANEQNDLYNRLLKMQLSACKKTMNWVNGMLSCLKQNEQFVMRKEIDCTPSKDLKPLHILNMAYRFWSNNYDLIKRNRLYAKEFILNFSTDDLIDWSCSLLYSFLHYLNEMAKSDSENADMQRFNDEFLRLQESPVASKDKTVLVTEGMPHFDDVIRSYSSNEGKSFLNELHKGNVMEESIVLFDIRNQMSSSSCSSAFEDLLWLSREDSPPAESHSGILGRLFGFIFGARQISGNASPEKTPTNEEDLHLQLHSLTEPGECKDLLLSLFESTFAVYMRLCNGTVTEAMQKNLRKIKSIILSKAVTDWENEETATLAVLQALQSLLKIAELSGSSAKSPDKEREYETPATAGAVEERTLASTESEGDFFSTRASLVCGDSEVELSENETEEFYQTADEGYEADGEIPENSESDDEVADPWTGFTPVSRYRTNVVHDGICKIVVEILFELSTKCVSSFTHAWSSTLSQLASRMFAIRNLLGGPLFLLQGFAPVLQCHGPEFKDLQESILDLILDLNSPDVLTTYFSILATKNPPIDILMRYLFFISTSMLKKQPSVEMSFPILNDGKCVSSERTQFVEEIERVRNYHLCNNASTLFLKSPCLLPITHGKLWGPFGLTVSLWMQMNSNTHQKSSATVIEDDSKAVYDDSLRTHVFSVGSNQAMISVYVNGNMNLVFECCRPNAELSPKCSPNETAKDENSSNNKENVPLNVTPPHNASPFRNALKQTKKVILNSFNPMHLFHGHGVGDGYFEGSSVELKYFRLCRNKWTHLCLAIDVAPDRFNITLIADGLEQHSICLPFRNVRNLTRTSTFQLLSLGDSLPKPSTEGSHAALDVLLSSALKFSISNLILFNRKIADREVVLNLTAMGPDFIDLTQCQVGGWKPNFGYLNLNKSYNVNTGNFHDAMKVLKQSRFLSYSASEPLIFMAYDPTYDRENVTGHKHNIILYGDLQSKPLKSVHTASLLCGGLSCFLYLFARVVEHSCDPSNQASALDLLLQIALSDMQLYTEFLRNDYVSLIGYVIKTEKCTKDVNLLASIVNNACTQPVIMRRGSVPQVNENTVACIAHPILLVSILHRYSDWYRSGAETCEVLETLFKSILALVRDKHPCKEFNIKQLNRVGVVKELLNLCKVYVVESPNPVYISVEAANSFANILSVFAGSPPSASLMDEIMKLLLLLHKPSECFVVHSRSNFYFLLKPTENGKTTEHSVPRRPFGPLFGERSRLNSRDTADDENARFRRFSFEKSPRTKNFNFASLEKIADCSRLNKKAVQSLSPSDCSSWRTPLRRHSMVHMPSNGSLGIRPHGMIRKRTRTRSRSTSSSEKRLRSETTPDSCADCSFGTNSIASESVSSIHFPSDSSVLHQMKSKSLCQVDFSQLPGIIKLQERLFTLLKDFLCLLPDNVVEEVLAHYVKIEIILALANHWSPNIRAAILKLLSALSKRVSANELAAISKKFYPQLLANQLAIHPTDAHMLETCLEWVTGLYGVLDGFNNYECITIQNKLGLNALLAILTQAVGLCDHAAKGFKVLRIIYLTDPESNQCLLENGLLQCCVKALYNMYTKATVPSASMENSIIELLTLVGEKAFKTVGQVNIIWDILNMLYFHQESNLINVIKGFRSVQGKLQLNWLKLFFSEQRPSSGFKVTLLPNSSLTLPETKTRLDLLIDRCSQFFTSFGPNYMPSDNEVKLFELLVSYGISTNTRCNNSIAWGLLASRPVELRQFIIDSLWMSCQNEAPSIMCDGKIIKALLWQCLLEQKESNQHPIQNLDSLCLRLGIRDVDTTWNLEQELERIEHTRHNVAAKQRSLLDKTMQKFESLAENCVETSMAITRVVSELQNSERTNLMNHMKEYDENYTFHKWLEIIRRMTHEGAPWYSINRCETSFELDATEGPSRVHTRMRRCHLDIDKRFIMEEYQKRGGRCDDYIRPLDYLVSSYDQQLNISQNSQILYFFPAKYLPVDAEIDGEIVVTVQKLYFIATYKCKYFYVSCDVANITEIWLKRYQHQEKAFEIFLDSNKSLFFSLQNQEDCKILKDIFLDKIITCPDQNKILLITQQWREGLLTNWEYLMTLNQISGRTYNDLMQYPVFPWILSNYTSDVLDLTDKKNFRKLEKPIAVQHEENEQHYVNNYSYINNTMTNMGTLQLKPYHYSSHYSNSGTVLHFLVRVPPFTSYFLRYQDNNFDLPDRTFHSLATTWSLASKDSPTDVKELIPEFFCLPEMFENSEGFDFGCRQSGERVEDVLLPPWCLRDPRLFVLIHRQALESEMVRQNIHHWIDLIFGHNQTGQNAVDAINVFHPATYAVFLESEITDPIERKAVETMIKTYGQMPKQLFKSPHPSSKPFNYCLGTREVIPTVKGLRWGVFLGSPQLPTPSLGHINKLPGAETLVSFNNTNMIYGLSSKSCVMQGPEADTYNVISWGNDDRIVRIQPLNETQTAAKALLYNSPLDEISCCGSDPNSNLLWCGHKSGLINVYKCQSMGQSSAKNRHSYMKSFKLSYNSATFRKLSPKSSLKMDDIEQAGEAQKPGNGTELIWSGPTALTRHTDEVTSICLSVEFKIAVSAGRDGLAVIWDLNDLSYVRTIERPAEIHHSPISLTAISPTLGDIVTVHTIPKSEHDPNITAQADECFEVTEESLDDFVNVSVNPNGKSILRLHTVNARYVNHIVHEDQILAVCYSYIKEGVGVNVIATAVEGGIIRLWSSWNLSLVIEIVTGISNIKSITYSTHQHLVVLTKDSYIQVWEAEGLYGNPPKFPQIVFK